MSRISEEEFEELLKEKLGEHWERSLNVFRGYGETLGFDVANVLLQAVEKQKVDEVLQKLEAHYEEHLFFQHPDIRGRVEKRGVNQTSQLFLFIYSVTLGLKPRVT